MSRTVPLTVAAAFCLVSTSCGLFQGNEETGEIQLFNGKSLDGWSYFLVDPNVKMDDVWSVENGILICKGEPLGYCHTEEEFTSFKLLVEWRWAPGLEMEGDEKPNSGVLMRINGEPRAIPRAIEAQLKSGDAGDIYGFHGMKVSADERAFTREGHELVGDMTGVSKMEGNENPLGEWNTYEITADGPNITVLVNGKKINEAKDCDVLAGPIGLQSEGGEIHFRKVVLTPLD
jgi:hypothetical protein